MKKIITIILAILFSQPAFAQSINDKQVMANTSGAPAAAVGTDPSTWFDGAYCNTVGYLLVRYTGLWTCSKAVALDVTWVGAIPGDGIDDAPAFRLAVSLVGTGGAIRVPAVSAPFLWDSCVNNAVIEITRNVAILGVNWSIKEGGSYANRGGSVIELGANIPDTCDGIHVYGTDFLFGWRVEDIAVTATGGAFSGYNRGRHFINIDGTGSDSFMLTNATIRRVFIDNMNTGVSIKAQANSTSAGGALAYSSIEESQIMSFDCSYCGDSIKFDHNTMGQNARTTGLACVRANLIQGATHLRISRNVMSCFNGMIILDGGTNFDIDSNELEQSGSFPNTYGTMVDFRGANSLIAGVFMRANGLSQNNSAGYVPLKIQNASRVQVAMNQISVPNSTVAEIVVTSAALKANIGMNACREAGVEVSCTVSNASSTTNSDPLGNTLFMGNNATVPPVAITSAQSPGNWVPFTQSAYGGGYGFTNFATWGRSQGDGALGSWARWDIPAGAWVYPFSSTYGSSLLTFNDNLTGSSCFYGAVSATVTAGTNIPFVKGLCSTGRGDISFPKIGAPAAPGAGRGQITVMAGSNPGTCKIVVTAGTSATPVTLADNVGAGC